MEFEWQFDCWFNLIATDVARSSTPEICNSLFLRLHLHSSGFSERWFHTNLGNCRPRFLVDLPFASVIDCTYKSTEVVSAYTYLLLLQAVAILFLPVGAFFSRNGSVGGYFRRAPNARGTPHFDPSDKTEE